MAAISFFLLLPQLTVFVHSLSREQTVGGMNQEMAGHAMGKPLNAVMSMTPPTQGAMSAGVQGQDTTVSSNTSFPAAAGPKEPPAGVGQAQGYRIGCQGHMNHGPGMQPAATQGSNYALKMSSPSQNSPGLAPGQPGSMLSPRHRVSPGTAGSPRLPPSQFSPAGSLHSPAGAMCGSTGNSHSYTSSSLNALQALSECHGVTLGQSLGSPDRKMGSPGNVPVNAPHPMTKMNSSDFKESLGSYGDQAAPDLAQDEACGDQKEDKENSLGQFGGGEGGEAQSRLHDSKGHTTKLLQLLTTKSEQMDPSSPAADPGCKDPGGPGGVAPNQGPGTAGSHAPSLKEKHKILHRLLQNTNPSPVDLAKLTAEATGKDLSQDSAGGLTAVAELAAKQEPGSPKKKDNALLRYLLDKDDTSLQDKGIKMEPVETKIDGSKLATVKTEKQDSDYDRSEQVSVKSNFPQFIMEARWAMRMSQDAVFWSCSRLK